MPSAENIRIMKNTLVLYIRMFLTMGVTLYTTRIILECIGIADYGIYNTLGGIVGLFVFINTAMVAATQRFLNYYSVQQPDDFMKKLFSICFIAHIIIGLLVVILSECVGLWFLYYKMSLPAERFNAAFWTLQFSIAIVFIQILRSPYNACIIAFEKMDFYAYISIGEVMLKLMVAYLLYLSSSDRLILFCILNLISISIITLGYKYYCNRKFEITQIFIVWDKYLFVDLCKFSGYSVLGNAANAAVLQGNNLMVNAFTNIFVNAAIGISNQVSQGIYALINNFQVAFSPQIVKTYAKHEWETLIILIQRSSRISFYLMLVVTIPIFIYNCQWLHFWLKEVPDYTVSFCRLSLLSLLIDTIAAPLWKTVQASGKIKRYQIVISCITLMNLPCTYFLLKYGYSPVLVFATHLCITFTTYLYRVNYVRKIIGFPIYQYIKTCIIPICWTAIISIALSMVVYIINIHYIISSVIIVVITCMAVFYVGLQFSERQYILNKLHNVLKK